MDCVTKLDHHLCIYVYYQAKQEESVIIGSCGKAHAGRMGGPQWRLGDGKPGGCRHRGRSGTETTSKRTQRALRPSGGGGGVSCGKAYAGRWGRHQWCHRGVERAGINGATGAWRGQAGADTDEGHETKPGAGERERSCGQEGEVEEEKEVGGPGGSSITVKHTPVDGGDQHINGTLRTKNLQGPGAGREPGKQPSMENQRSYGQEGEEEKEEVGGPGGSSITVKHMPVDGEDLHINGTLKTKNLQGPGAGREPGKQPSMEHQRSYGQEGEEEKKEVGLLSKEAEKKPFKSIVKNATSEQPGGELLLSRYHQGLGACLEQTRLNEALEKPVRALRSTMKYSRRRATITNLPQPWVEKILENLKYPDLCRAVSSSYFFLRVSMSPCHCGAFIKHSSFLAAIVQPTQGCPRVTVASRMSRRLLEPASRMLQRYIAVVYRSRRWYKILDCRKGHILVSRHSTSMQLDVMRPFHTMLAQTLPTVSLSDQETLIAAVILPWEEHFSVIMISGSVESINWRIFRSDEGFWIQRRASCSIDTSNLSSLRSHAVFASDRLYLLDAHNNRILHFSTDKNVLGTVPLLPACSGKLIVKNNILGRTRCGNVCWAMLDQTDISIFILDGTHWTRRWKWLLPENLYSCCLVGFAEQSGLLMIECFGIIGCLDMETGKVTYLEETISRRDCLCFEMGHSLADHV